MPRLMEPSSDSRRSPFGRTAIRCVSFAAPILLILAVMAAYLPAINGSFVFDDVCWTTQIQHLLRDAGGLKRMWADTEALQQYYPLTGTSFWLEYQLWGFWTTGSHLINVGLHLISVFLFWRLLVRLRVPGAAFAAALFALHPVMAESVAWITERKNVLSQSLVLAAAVCYLRYADWGGDGSRRSAWYAPSLVLFAAAVLAKTLSVALVPALVVIAWWKGGLPQVKRHLLSLIPFAVVAMVLGLLVMHLEQDHIGARELHAGVTVLERGLVACRVIWFYLGKLIVPVNLCLIYPAWDISSTSLQPWLWLLLTLAAGFSAWFWRAKIGRGAWAAIACYLVALIPVLGFVNVYGQAYAWVWDHWAYLPSLAFFALAGAGAEKLTRRLGRLEAGLLACCVLAGLGVLTMRASEKFNSDREAWEDTLRCNPNCATAWHNLGYGLSNGGSYWAAISFYERAISLNPRAYESLFNLATCYDALGETAKAVQAYQRAISIRPDSKASWKNLGKDLLVLGKVAEARDAFAEFVKLEPSQAHGHESFAICCLIAQRPAEAAAAFRRAIDIEPNSPTSLQFLSWLRSTSPDASLRNGREALDLAQRLMRLLPPNSADGHRIIAAAHAELGDFAEAVKEVAEAERLARAAGADGEPLAALQKQRAAYEQGKAWHEQPPAPKSGEAKQP